MVLVLDWDTEGSKAPTLGRHVSACNTILRLRALLYLGCVRHARACATILLLPYRSLGEGPDIRPVR